LNLQQRKGKKSIICMDNIKKGSERRGNTGKFTNPESLMNRG
jgi:hypothetical protein